jgi:hypothetical protein
VAGTSQADERLTPHNVDRGFVLAADARDVFDAAGVP